MLWVRSLRLGFRSLFRSPGFTAVAVLTLALGVGTTTSIFSIVNGVMLNPLPWRNPESVVSIEVHKPKHDPAAHECTHGQFLDLQHEARSYAGLAAVQFEFGYLTDREAPYRVETPRVTANGFAIARVKPLLGRTFDEHDGRPGSEPVAMMSEQLWVDRYGADPSILGRKLELDGQQTTIIGVTATIHWFPFPSASILRPLIFTTEAPSREGDRLRVVGRLNPGVTLRQAQAELDLIGERLARRYPTTDGNLDLSVQLTRDAIVGPHAKAGTLFLTGAVGFVLLIVCANLAGLLLARAAGRQKEIATRAALGATHWQIMAQLLTECAAIALLALPVALLITHVCHDYILSLVPAAMSYVREFLRLDVRVIAVAVLTTAGTVLLFGLYPSIRATRLDLNMSLKSGGRGSTDGGAQRLRSMLVVAQLALAVSLLATSSLFSQAFAKVRTVKPGFDTAGVLVAEIALPDARYDQPDKIREFQQRVSSTLAELPGGVQAALVSSAPLGREGSWSQFQIAGRETSASEQPPRARWMSASPAYFSTLGLRTLAGRTFTAADTAGSQQVVVVTKALADKYFPGESPLGRRIDLKLGSASGALRSGVCEIVGVVSDVKTFPGLDAPIDEPRIYEPLAQQSTPTFAVVIRSPGNTQLVSTLVRQRVRSMDPLLDVTNIETMETRFDRAIWRSTFFIRLMSILGALAFVLASIGTYGIVSYTTASRTREFGIRAALGAEPAQIAKLVLRRTLVLGCWGSTLGVLLAVLWGKASQKVLYGSVNQDPLTLGGVLLVLVLMMLVASALPTLRATRVNPADSLRAE